MAAPRGSFGFALLLKSRPDLKFDLEQLPPKLIESGTLDQIAVELEVMHTGSALEIRTNALAFLRGWILEKGRMPEEHIVWLYQLDHDLGVWASLACAHDALRWVPKPFVHSRRVVELVTQWLQGFSSETDVLDARDEMRVQEINGSRGQVMIALASISDAAYSIKRNRAEYASDAAREAAIAAQWENQSESQLRRERVRLSSVIADAMPGMPVRIR